MQASQIPAKFPLPFAATAGSSYIRPIPAASQIGITNGAASLTDGFPPLTSIPIAAGGTPPSIKDFNGIMQQATAWLQWQNAGGPVSYDSVFSAAIGGYPKGAVLSAASFGNYWLSTVDNNTSDPDTGGANWIGFSFISAATGISGGEGIQVTSASATFTGSISGTTLSVSAVGSGTIAVGMTLSDSTSAIASGTTITGLGTGTGGTGTYVVSNSQTVGSEAMTGTLKTVNLAFQNLITENTINGNDLVAFYAEEIEGGEPAHHHYSTTVANFATQIASLIPGPIPGSRKNLKIVTATTSTINLTADFVTLGSAGTLAYTVSSVSLSISTATSGAGGVDTGSIASSEPYDIYLGYSPGTSTAAAWLTIEGNAPTVPSGYTFYQRVGWTRTDGSAHLYNILQIDDQWQYLLQSSGNTAAFPVVASGPIGSESNWSTWSPATVSLAGVVPVKSIAVDFYLYTFSGSAAVCSLSPNSNWLPYMALSGPNSGSPGRGRVILEQVQTVFVALQAGSSYAGVEGGWINI
jgi:hypothetical protein